MVQHADGGGRAIKQTFCDVISARAFAPLPRLLTYAHPFWHKDTLGLFLKGENVSKELTEAKKYWKFNVEEIESRSQALGLILKVTDLTPL